MRIVDAQFARLAPSRARFLAEGWDSESLDTRRCAKSLGAFLSSLHAFPAGEARALGAPERPPPDPAALVGWFHARWPDVAPVLPSSLRERTERFFSEAALQTPDIGPRLVHDDLHSDHILRRKPAMWYSSFGMVWWRAAARTHFASCTHDPPRRTRMSPDAAPDGSTASSDV